MDVKGHLLKIKVDLVAGVGIKPGIAMELEIDKDDSGYYRQPQSTFERGESLYYEYVKVKKDSGGEDGSASWGMENKPNMTEKETTEHVWIEEKKLDTRKHYFIEC